MMKSSKIFAAAALAITFMSNASATVVYENGTDGNFRGGNNPFTYRVVTTEFTLAQAATVTSFTYNAFTTGDTLPVSNVFLNFSQDGANVYTGNLSVANTNVIGRMYGYDLTDYTVNLPSVSLAAGTYLMGIQVSPNQWNQHWSIINGSGALSDDGRRYYFRLESNAAASAVPEPSSIALLLLGVAGVVVARRKKAQK